MLSFLLRVLVLHSFIVLFSTLQLFAEDNEWIKFSDNDSRGGWLSGNLIFKIPEDVKISKKINSISKFVLHWGNNPHQRLGMFLPIVSFPVTKIESQMIIQFNATKVPPGATHFLLFALDKNEKGDEVFSLPLIDKGVPTSKPKDLFFEQSGKIGNRVKGRIILTRAWDERDLSHYAVYWGTGPRTVLRTKPPVVVLKKKSWFGSLISQIQSPWRDTSITEEIDVLLPNEATHLIAFSRNFEGQMNQGVSFKLDSETLKDKAKKNRLVLERKPSIKKIIEGKITLFRKKKEETSNDYLFFWGKDDKNRIKDLPPLAKFEVKKIRDGMNEKEILVSSLTMMDQKLQVSTLDGDSDGLVYTFPKNTFVPDGASFILAFTQQKFWFQDDVERRLKGPIASVSLDDPEGIKKKDKIKKKLKLELKDFSIGKFKINNETEEEKLILDSSANEEITNQELRISEYRGLGIGLSISGLNGVYAFYDYNYDGSHQFHFDLDLTGPQVGSMFKALRLTNEDTNMGSVGKSLSGNLLEINRTLFSAVFRWFVDDSLVWGITEGFYYGFGGGIGYATLNYKGRDSRGVAKISGENESFTSTSTEYKHSTQGTGIFAVIDAGWQGIKNYYFQIAFQPAIYIIYQDGFEESSIPVNPSQRSTVSDRWSKAKNPSRILLGFGVFF